MFLMNFKVYYNVGNDCLFRGFSSGRGNFETAPHIDTWTNEKTVNGDKDVSIGGVYSLYCIGIDDIRHCKG